MGELSPGSFIWRDGAMIPTTSYQLKRCDEHFKDGERYFLVEHQDRSINSHNHYFASVREAWMNLPEAEAVKYPDSIMLRKRALIMTGWRDETVTACKTSEDALRLAAMLEAMDRYAVVLVNDCVVTTLRAKSQKIKAMSKKDFQQSKTEVLAWVWNLVGVDPALGNKEAGKAA